MKARLLAVLLVATLVLVSAASVALAQTSGKHRNASVQYVDCSQVQAAVQGQYGNADAIAVDESETVAEVSQEMNISQNQVNACLGEIGGSPDGNRDGDEAKEEAEGNVIAKTIPKVAELPDTGGPSLLAVGVGLALAAGGASLIRFRR